MFEWDDYPAGTVWGDLAREVYRWAEGVLVSESFKERTDYSKGLKLLLMILGLPLSLGYVFPRPVEVSNARFLQRGLYYLEMFLLMGILAVSQLFTAEERAFIKKMAFYSAIFYLPHFLKSPLLTR